MKPEPKDGIVWITGASSGLGRAFAIDLARRGFRIVGSARSADKLGEVERAVRNFGGSFAAYPLDITDRAAVTVATHEIGKAHGWIALAILNAGTHEPVRAKSFSADPFCKLIDINVMGQIYCLEALLPSMIARGTGHIALVASVAGYCGLPGAAAYSLTKAGLIAMAEALKPDLDPLGVKLQIVNPGFVKTPLTDLNDFPMPFLMAPEAAAAALYRGLCSSKFEITFPRRLALLVKFLSSLPYPLFFAITRRLRPAD